MSGPTRRPTAYRRHVLTVIEDLLQPVGPVARALDFGAGDGWFARQLTLRGRAEQIVAAEVRPWPSDDRRRVIFDGNRLPFMDKAFGLAYAIDVIHHCAV